MVLPNMDEWPMPYWPETQNVTGELTFQPQLMRYSSILEQCGEEEEELFNVCVFR